jgi:hypothetical protein
MPMLNVFRREDGTRPAEAAELAVEEARRI